MGDPQKVQEAVDAVIKSAALGNLTAEARLLKLAQVGLCDPTALTINEAKEVFGAFIVHYAQMGIT